MLSVAEATVSAPRSQHSWSALAKNSHPRTVFTALRAAASRRSIPTVTSFPQNDNLSGRARRLIRISIIKTKRTPVPPCHCERSVAISRKGNVGNAPAPAHSPAVAHRRTPVPPCHCERSVAISRKGNVGNEHAPANSPAQALRRSQLNITRRDEGVPPYRRLRRE